MNITRTDVSVKKNPELLPESLKLNGNIFFELFSTDLDERLASADYQKDQEKKQNKTAEQQ